ncbi:hypothetical protein E0H89_00670 [Acinetobacter sp. ANC 3781]|uniref:hypothetical protein n=1 Tax=Acinetobacter sp. ANC 3781 TaxID=2529835 RepID=UPI00103AA531|nr:hypothetical protein [Acinetobacter sp. ANC 3781]TCB80176.1 hypothetical protein E0H89_00670 [Acinetobacter sp. ANC 3781]
MDIKGFKAWAESKKLSTDGETGRNYSYTFYDSKTQAAWDAWQAKAQAVPEVITIGNELQSWVAVWSFRAKNDGEDYVVVDANLLAEKIEKLTGANA